MRKLRFSSSRAPPGRALWLKKSPWSVSELTEQALDVPSNFIVDDSGLDLAYFFDVPGGALVTGASSPSVVSFGTRIEPSEIRWLLATTPLTVGLVGVYLVERRRPWFSFS